MNQFQPSVADTALTRTYGEAFAASHLQSIFISVVAHSKTTGIDGVSPSRLKRDVVDVSLHLERQLQSGTFQFTPYRQVLRLKGAQKPPRVLSVPTVRDRIVLRALLERLHETLPQCVARRLPNEYIRQLKEQAQRIQGCSFIKADIASFYDEIDQAELLRILAPRLDQQTLRLVEKAIRNPTVPAGRRGIATRSLRAVGKGVPQGLAISNILAEVYLEQFDAILRPICVGYLRYVDDILLIFPSGERDTVAQALEHELVSARLKESKGKRKEGSVGEAFDYLGYELALPRVSVRTQTLDKFIDSIIGQLAGWSHAEAEGRHPKWLDRSARESTLLDEVNERITGAISEDRRYGWLFYFLELTDVQVLFRLDAILREAWCRFVGPNVPRGLKKFSRAFWEAKHRADGTYIHNYNRYDTLARKLEFLRRQGEIDPKSPQRYSQDEIVELFHQVRDRRLRRLELDDGFAS